MNHFKKFSLLLVLTPALFIGCTTEKTTSLKPLQTDKNVSKLKTEKTLVSEVPVLSKEEQLLASAVFGGEILVDNKEDSKKPNDDFLTSQTLDTKANWQASSKEDKILETARKFLGVKYIWAANGPSAFDCSGFTKYVFKKSGITLPRYSGHQANVGKKIKFSNMQKGDLVFFDTKKKFTREVNHVGIFVGNNKFIHASSGGKRVMITSFAKKKFYKNKFLYARRVIDNGNSFALNDKIEKPSTSIN